MFGRFPLLPKEGTLILKKSTGVVIRTPFSVISACVSALCIFYKAFLTTPPGAKPLGHPSLLRMEGKCCCSSEQLLSPDQHTPCLLREKGVDGVFVYPQVAESIIIPVSHIRKIINGLFYFL